MPCGDLRQLHGIAQGHSVDVIEIDGASNTSVDDVREIRENVKFTPLRGHPTASTSSTKSICSRIRAFNALLKTLEEPPSHVVFIFATTEIHKIPATILAASITIFAESRAEIIDRLRHVADQDGIPSRNAA